MYLFSLAVIPAIVLLVYIYKKDTVEKEPLSLLMKCFGFGALATIPILGWELLMSFIFIKLPGIVNGSYGYALIKGFFIAAFCEECLKFLVLKKITWKNKNFDYLFDGIVYAVFVSLGFATIENIEYVFFMGGESTAIIRAFTALPGHTCFAVFMGCYYGAAKQAEIQGQSKNSKQLLAKAFFVPMLIHGIYDALIMVSPDVVGESISSSAITIWWLFFFGIFQSAFKKVKDTSRYDQKFIKKSEQ